MRIKTSLKYTMALGCFAACSAVAAEIPTNAALMQAMDKVTGRVNKITVPVNSKVAFGDFSLVLRACKKRPAEEIPENFAFVDVTDKSFGADEYNIFRGWLLSSTPGINAIEHPIYDVWLLECVDADVKAEDLLSEDELKRRDALPAKEVLTEVPPAVVDKEEISEEPKAIRIKDFINEDRDIEKDIKVVPSYISEISTPYVSDIEEGDEPENLLIFTKMQEEQKAESVPSSHEETAIQEDDLSDAIEAEIKSLQ